MDLSKYLDLIMRENLFFANAKNLGDPFENTTTSNTLKLAEHWIENRDTLNFPEPMRQIPQEDFEKLIRRQTQGVLTEELFVNCWHMNDEESDAMWRVYSKSNESVCIVSDYETLAEELPHYCCLGSVNYVDYETHTMDLAMGLSKIVHKRPHFSYENELRAVVWKMNLAALVNTKDYRLEDLESASTVLENMTEVGAHVPININKLIKEIRINPRASEFFHQLVQDVSRKLNCTVPIVPSSLVKQPVYPTV